MLVQLYFIFDQLIHLSAYEQGYLTALANYSVSLDPVLCPMLTNAPTRPGNRHLTNQIDIYCCLRGDITVIAFL
jgi:hypothetical protein